MATLGFLINPIAGMGGRVGLKGTDGVADRARELGARPSAHLKAEEALAALADLLARTPHAPALRWLTCAGAMGADALSAAGFSAIESIHVPAATCTAEDTRAAAACFLERGVELVLFCGGDGTARDLAQVVGQRIPILGVPAGVKMYSGVFGTSPRRTAEILLGFLQGSLSLSAADVLDLDEERYRRGEWVVRLYHAAQTPYEPSFTQSAKMLISAASDDEVKIEIASHLREVIEASPDTLFLLGPGSTVQAVAGALGVAKTLLGIDAVVAGRLVAADLDERGILALLDAHPRVRLILSPIGAQGFVLGRGNLQLTPQIVTRIGIANLIVVATPAKLARTPLLHVDTGEPALDQALAASGYLPVVIGYRLRRLVRVAI